ncbi:V-type ATP synthase subunit A [Nitrosococcus watsonii]|uniref:V-type ATP synthase alpha chain n=1 Tax=Nitrosococcus watsoni (strain C-113) TaxID=105559 RepID=D8K4X0_NITWC|nr:V-type ATP synthase subunit A [Nitrosococcus watsonii]ADJ27947.1 H(+)-transporting two-sector ATPase [Nitrosococcus watsonii C-113]
MGKLLEVNGPLVRARLPQVPNGEQVRIGTLGLVGEVIGREGQEALIQVYEGTESVRPGEEVEALGHPLSVELGPGLLGQVFDGIQRPLGRLLEVSGDRISRGIQIQGLEQARVWRFQPNPQLAAGMTVTGGVCLGAVPETPTIEHRILVPPELSGELLELAPAGEYRLSDVIARLDTGDHRSQALTLSHRWPVRNPRPYQQREHGVAPLMTGQRILDTFFPLLKGGKAAVPGPFGAGKTMVQQQIARWSNADIVIYVGCGERGNELVEVLDSFPELTDPHTGRSLMERTLLVANTSNMPVVAREASLYVGVTLGEYYRDQGYDVVIVADSTSRWAEALREVAGRLGQMPVEEGYPAYLASRLAAFYERAGRVQTLGGNVGSVTLIGAVSPPGGDFSEPVTSHTKEIVRTFWALSKELADARHYPAVSWRESFSDDIAVAARWWAEQIDKHWQAGRAEAMTLLTQAEELSRIVNLVGPEALSGTQRWALEGAMLIKEGLLQQSALDPVDSFCTPEKQFVLLDLMLQVYHRGVELLEQGVPVQELLGLPILTRAKRCKSDYENTRVESLRDFAKEIKEVFSQLSEEYAGTGKPSG